jgi:hypothetical protein
MKNSHTLLYLFLLTFICFSCKENYSSKISKKIEIHIKDVLDSYDYVVIIPGSGCSGCITAAEQFFIDNITNDKIKFILTNNFSRKELNLRLKEENLQRKNVLIDDDNLFYLIDFEEKIYPMIVSINNKKIIDVQILNNFIQD